MKDSLCFHTLVIGSGCAGWNAADQLKMLGIDSVALVTEDVNAGTSRNTGSDKQTYYKLSLSGNIPDSVGSMTSSLFGPDVNGDTALCEAASSAFCFLRLANLGVPFPTNEYGEYVGYQTDHDNTCRASSAGPLTSRFMTEALEKSARAHGVTVLDHLLACKIETDENSVRGLLCLDTVRHKWEFIRCANIVLCTGGPAHVYHSRVYPESQHGMSSLAFMAGADGANLDCWQYGMASVSFRWNVSGSYQQAIPRYVSVDENGVEREFLTESLSPKEMLNHVFLKGYQWPFDERRKDASSRIDLLVKAQTDAGRRVYLDYRKNPAGWDIVLLDDEARSYLEKCRALGGTPFDRLRAINAPAIELYRAHGIYLEKEMLEIRVCAQHHNGGVAVDANWQTKIKGLYCCGEAAGTFGKRRPGGSALNSTQVGSLRAARHIALSNRTISDRNDYTLLQVSTLGISEVKEHLQKQMDRCAGIQRDLTGIAEMENEIAGLLERTVPAEPDDPELRDKLLFMDMLVTQRYVLSAMRYSLSHSDEGVLMTDTDGSRRVPSRPFPERDLWFERVWKQYRKENHL